MVIEDIIELIENKEFKIKFLLEIEGGIDGGRFTGEGRKILQWRGRRGNIRETSELLKQALTSSRKF